MMDFSVAYLETGFSFVTLKQESFNTWAFLEPFDTRLWLYIFFTVILVSLFMFISNFVSFLRISREIFFIKISPYGYYSDFYKPVNRHRDRIASNTDDRILAAVQESVSKLIFSID